MTPRLPLTRRDFLGASLAASGLSLTQANAFSFSQSPGFAVEPGRFSVSIGEKSWRLDAADFDGKPTLALSNEELRYRGSLLNALFAGTSTRADLDFEIAQFDSGEWIFSLQFRSLPIAVRGTLGQWLGGGAFAISAPFELANGHPASLGLSGTATSIDSTWRLRLDRNANLSIGKREFVSDDMSILLCGDSSSANSARMEISDAAARLIAGHAWLPPDGTVAAASIKSSTVAIRYQSLADGSVLLVEPVSRTERMAVEITTTGGGSAKLWLENYRIAESFAADSISQAIAGDIAADGSSLATEGMLFSLSGMGASSDFVVETENGNLTRLSCAPSVIASSLPVADALTSPFPLSQPHVIRFVGPGPQIEQEERPLLVAQAQTVMTDASTFPGLGYGQDVVTGHVTCEGCSLDGKPSNLRYFSTQITRAEDLLWLGFEFYNFVFKSEGGEKYLEPLKVAGPALVIVHFPPQHILEDAYNEDLGCGPNPPEIVFPLRAKMSGPSRLVFELPADVNRLDLTVDSLTDWARWKVRKVPDSRHPNLIRAPVWDETSVELPSRIISQPANDTHWRSKRYEGADAKRYVLFHTELRPDVPFDPAEPTNVRRARFVPIWTPDFEESGVEIPAKPLEFRDFLRLKLRKVGLERPGATSGPAPGCVPPSPPDDLQPGQSEPINEQERREIVRLSHDSTICATPPAAKHFILTPRGGFADVEGYWPQTRARSCVNISLEKWNHVVTEAQDQKITIEKRYLCFPFGHRVIYIKDTNRKTHKQNGKYFAVEKTTYRIVIRQRTVDYRTMRVDPAQDRSYQLPYRTLTITDRTVPSFDEPQFLASLKADPLCLDAFWPTRCGAPLELNFKGVDWAGNVVSFAAKVLLVQDTARPSHADEISAEYRAPTVQPAMDANPRRHDLGGQLSALAPSYQKGDTEVVALRVDFDALEQSLKFGDDFCPAPGEEITDEELCQILDYGETELSAPFYPIAYAVEARLPTLSRIATSGGGEMWMEVADPLRNQDPLEVFAFKHPDTDYQSRGYTLAFNRESDRSGGVAAPTPRIDAVSRLKGPVGLSDDSRFARSNYAPLGTSSVAGIPGLPTPSSFFSVLDSKILGVLSPRDLLSELGIDLSMPTLLSFLLIGGDTSSSTGFVYDWDTDKLKDWPGDDFGFQFKSTLAEGGPKAKLSITGGVELELAEDAKPRGYISGSLSNFRLRLVFVGNGIEAPFPAVRFHAPLGEKVKFDVSIGDVKFIGPLMEFATALKEYLDLGDGYDIDVRFDSLTASIGPFALPAIGFGVFSLSNIGFAASCSIYFRDNRPMAFGFAFASRDKPFTLAVAFLAGRGHFLFEVDTSGLQRIEASLEFGAYAELAFGSVAHGYLYVMGGVFYSSTKVREQIGDAVVFTTEIALEIYVRFGGGLTCLGFISISVDVHLGLYIAKRGSQTFAEGRASITYSVKIGFFKKSFSVSYSKSLPGSDAPPEQQSILLPNMQLADDVARTAERGHCSPVTCIDAMTKAGFRTYWYAFEGRLAS
jgi:hypothetical protein